MFGFGATKDPNLTAFTKMVTKSIYSRVLYQLAMLYQGGRAFFDFEQLKDMFISIKLLERAAKLDDMEAAKWLASYHTRTTPEKNYVDLVKSAEYMCFAMVLGDYRGKDNLQWLLNDKSMLENKPSELAKQIKTQLASPELSLIRSALNPEERLPQPLKHVLSDKKKTHGECVVM